MRKQWPSPASFVFTSSLVAFSNQLYDDVTVVAEWQYIVERMRVKIKRNMQETCLELQIL
jgi:hypothetical protein